MEERERQQQEKVEKERRQRQRRRGSAMWCIGRRASSRRCDISKSCGGARDGAARTCCTRSARLEQPLLAPMSATFTQAASARSADAFPPPPLTTLAQLLAELNLPQPATDTLLSLNACAATLHANGRPVLLKLLAREGFVAGHAQKIATAIARELRSKRIAFDASEAIALPPSPAIASFISSPSVETAVAAGDALKLATALRAMDGRLPPRSCLATASKHGHTECVALLLTHNADPDAVGADHLSPLHHASRRKHIEIVTQLIAAKASINLAVSGGSTPLHAASASGHHEVVSL